MFGGFAIKFRDRYTPALIAIAVAGLSIIGAGALSQNPQLAIFLSSLGGAVFGASFSGVVSNLSESVLTGNILDILRETLSSKILSDENNLPRYRKRWFHYELSQRRKGRLYWAATIYDFCNTNLQGKLASTITWYDNNGKDQQYRIEGAVRDSRVLFFIKALASDEPIAIEIFPFMGETFRTTHCGFWLMVTWDGNNTLMPTIISDQPLFGVRKAGPVPDDLSDAFYDEWRAGFKQIHNFLPTSSNN